MDQVFSGYHKIRTLGRRFLSKVLSLFTVLDSAYLFYHVVCGISLLVLIQQSKFSRTFLQTVDVINVLPVAKWSGFEQYSHHDAYGVETDRPSATSTKPLLVRLVSSTCRTMVLLSWRQITRHRWLKVYTGTGEFRPAGTLKSTSCIQRLNRSVRISSQAQYNTGLFILDLNRAPWGCGRFVPILLQWIYWFISSISCLARFLDSWRELAICSFVARDSAEVSDISTFRTVKSTS